ncbi:hypothetical protein C7999DRAFT_27864 [Corynascus novoguineensis]|uniref:Developmental regulator protein n=1 Tax=Corynascus novoguineensis TaxID=1126955 RepID=A0AAN7HUC7_9PEZI|nr:hypothetical protein C7999DRAFT_27864 [Corynascus novoguineensis]
MPAYLCHGFRWQRQSIRVHVILQDLDDASPEWIIPAKSSRCILNSFYELFNFLPDCSPERGRRYSSIGGTDSDYDDRTLSYARGRNPSRDRSQSRSTHQARSRSRAIQQQQQQPPPIPPLPASNVRTDSTLFAASDDEFEAQSWSAIKLLEEYDPRDLTTVSRPYAYVADYAIRIDLSCSIVDEIAKYEQQQLPSGYPAVSISAGDSPTQGPGWFEQLRDELQRGEEIRWYVVVNNDEAREWASESPEPESAPGLDLNLRRQQYQQYQESQLHSSEHQTQQGRPTPSRKQIQHHAQYLQQIIFDLETKQAQEISQSQPGIRQEAKDEQQPPQSTSKTKAYQQQEFDLGVQQQQLILEKSRQQRRREKEQEQQLQMGRVSKQDGKTGEKQRLERNLRPPPPMNGADANGPPPVVPEKDHQYPLPPTAKSKGNTTTTPLRPELSIDTGGAKTSGKKGGRLRRFFSRTRLQASGESSP